MTTNSTEKPDGKALALTEKNHWRTARAGRASIIVDAADYFRVIQTAMRDAKHRIIIVGWDFDTRIDLDPDEAGTPDLGHFILQLAKDKPQLDIRILKWDFGALKSLFRGSHMWMLFRWWRTRSIHFKFDGKHPPGCSHHQKLVVIDDAIAVCGGIDMTHDRWDTRNHVDDDPRRIEPNGQPYSPWHDMTSVLDGDAAAALGDLCRDRWKFAAGEALEPSPPQKPRWIEGLDVDFEGLDVAIARTRAEYKDEPEIREVEQLYLDMIASAERFIYSENQYFTSPRIAAAITKRLAERPYLEIVMVQPKTAEGWIEQMAMDGTRVRIARMIGECDPQDRLRIYYPVTTGGTPIYVHAKMMIVDDAMLRIGSSNMNNRSLGLDSECDVMFDSVRSDDPAATQRAIRRIRHGLLAEHLGLDEERVAKALEKDSMRALIENHSAEGRRLVPIDMEEPEDFEAFVADKQLLDPECADEMFEPLKKRSLLRSFFKNLRSRTPGRVQP